MRHKETNKEILTSAAYLIHAAIGRTTDIVLDDTITSMRRSDVFNMKSELVEMESELVKLIYRYDWILK